MSLHQFYITQAEGAPFSVRSDRRKWDQFPHSLSFFFPLRAVLRGWLNQFFFGGGMIGLQARHKTKEHEKMTSPTRFWQGECVVPDRFLVQSHDHQNTSTRHLLFTTFLIFGDSQERKQQDEIRFRFCSVAWNRLCISQMSDSRNKNGWHQTHV